MLLQEYLKKMKELQAKVNSMDKQLSEKDDAEQNNELANEKISTLQDMLKQKTLELSDAATRIDELEDSSKENHILDELKKNHAVELESYKEQILKLQTTSDQRFMMLSEANERVEVLEKSEKNAEIVEDLMANHAHELDSYREQISLVQDTLKQKLMELDEATEGLDAMREREKGEFNSDDFKHVNVRDALTE
jgi:chromosome segregation ATPase